MLRLIIAIVLLLFSLLVIVKSPVYSLWLVAVFITSYPYWLMGFSLVSLWTGFAAEQYRGLVLICSSFALVLYALPVINACLNRQQVAEGLGQVFPDTSHYAKLVSPFYIKGMFASINGSAVPAKELRYVTTGGRKLLFDFYPSYKREASPVVIVIHGGSWESGDCRQLPALNSFLANHGYHVAAINYRLAPAFRFPAPVEDTRNVIDYLVKHATELNIDTSRFVLLGRSAGGQIALMAAYTLGYKNIKGVIAYYAPADMVWGGQVKTNKLVLNTEKIYHGYFGGIYKEVPEIFRQASACEFVNEQSPPTLLIHGAIDALVAYEHSIHLSARLDHYKVKHYFLQLPFATHGCDYNINSPAGQLSTFAAEHFIHAVTQ